MGFEFLLLVGLGVWAYLQGQRIGGLKRDIATLSRELSTLQHLFEARARREAPDEAPMPAPANETLPELLLTEVVEEPPAPAAMTPPTLVEPGAPELPELVLTQAVPPAAPMARPFAPKKEKPSRSLEQWLSENGLAWIAGGAIALGGVFLVGWASQQGFFTPVLRLYAALALGLVLIGAGEWVRNIARKRPFGHPLAGALLAGAGASTLYAASWAAYGIYGYIHWPVAAAALTLCAAILFALSFRHGQALGVLAIVAALLTPLLSTMEAWPPLALAPYLIAVGAGGLAIAAFQRWSWLAAATMLGAYVWFALSIEQHALQRALAMLELTAVGGWLLGFRAPHPDEEDATIPWGGVQAWLPSIALSLGALFAALCWNVAAVSAPASLPGPALVSMFLAALAAFAVRAGVARPTALEAAIGGMVLGAFSFARNVSSLRGEMDLYPWALICAGVAALAALAAAARSKDRALISGFGAFSALFLLVIAAITRTIWPSPEVWAALAVGAVLLAGAAEYASRSASDPTKDLSVDYWAGAGAAAFLLALESFAPVHLRPAADAGAALVFAMVCVQRDWRIAGPAAVAAAALALTHALSPAFAGAAWEGALNIWLASAVLALSAIGIFGASWVIRRDAKTQAAEALDVAAILIWLLAAFLLLHTYAAGRGRLDAFTEDALRALMLIAAGFMAMPRTGRSEGWIARWRGHVLMAAGLAFGVLAAGLMFNPWWGVEPARIEGAPLLNIQAIAFAAPAVFAFLSANRLYARARTPARLYAGIGALFAVMWIVLELRRAFHGAAMSSGAVGLIEGDAYGLAALAIACVQAHWTRRRAMPAASGRPFTHDLVQITGITAFAGILIGASLLLLTRNAWWGAQDAANTSALATALASLAQAPAAALAVLLGLALPKRATNAMFAAASAANLFALTFGALAIRRLYHQGAMDDRPPMFGVEGLLYAIWPLALVAIGATWTEELAKRPGARALTHDLNALWSVGAWPALAFAGFGLWAMFNPWRGVWPAQTYGLLDAFAALLIFAAAAALSLGVARLRVMAHDPLFPNAAKIAAILHIFAAAMLVVRRVFQGGDMATLEAPTNFETWTYSAVWAIYGAAVWGWGAFRRDAIVRWAGLLLLLSVSVKVFAFDMRQLSFVVRAASFLGLGGVLMLVALAARRFGQTASTPVSTSLRD